MLKSFVAIAEACLHLRASALEPFFMAQATAATGEWQLGRIQRRGGWRPHLFCPRLLVLATGVINDPAESASCQELGHIRCVV